MSLNIRQTSGNLHGKVCRQVHTKTSNLCVSNKLNRNHNVEQTTIDSKKTILLSMFAEVNVAVKKY